MMLENILMKLPKKLKEKEEGKHILQLLVALMLMVLMIPLN
jgi:hypothetical protein